jgi:HEAT repeat protein
MKPYTILLAVIFLIISSSASIYSQDSIKVLPKINKKSIVKNYLEGMNSKNEGLRISSAYYLGERKSSQAVIPLMDMLHMDKSPSARIMAALSLFKIGDERGIYALKEAITFDKSEWVRNMCKVFYQMYLTNEKTEKKNTTAQ